MESGHRQASDPRGGSREVVLKEPPPEQATRNLHTLAQVVKEELSFNTNAGTDKLTYFSWRSGVLLRCILIICYKSGG